MNWTPLQVTNSDVPNQLEPLDSYLKESFNNLGFKTSLDSMSKFQERLKEELAKQGLDRTPSEDDVKQLGLLNSLHKDLKGFQELPFLTTDAKSGLGIAIEQVERYIRDNAPSPSSE